MKILDGKALSEELEKTLVSKIKKLKISLKLAVILVGDNPSSLLYVKMKQKTCQRLGVGCDVYHYKEASQSEIIHKIKELNQQDDVTGILIQLPLPGGVDTRTILDTVAIKKDVDGLHSYHLMRILMDQEKIVPCTPKGIIALLDKYKITLEGKGVCVIGFSDVVGKPLATMCLNRGATVTVCHVKTNNLDRHTSNSDIVMTATGVPRLIKKDMIKDSAIVVDIGISKHNGEVVGDVDFDSVKDKCSYITPVPGGVGPMTIHSLIQNLLLLHEYYH